MVEDKPISPLRMQVISVTFLIFIFLWIALGFMKAYVFIFLVYLFGSLNTAKAVDRHDLFLANVFVFVILIPLIYAAWRF